MEERFDRLEQLIIGVDGQVDALDRRLGIQEQKTDSIAAQLTVQGKRLENVEQLARATVTRLDAVSLQIAGVSKRVDRLSTRHDAHEKRTRRVAAEISRRLKKADAKAQITIEGHEAIRHEMRREFAQLRREVSVRVQPLELAVRKRR